MIWAWAPSWVLSDVLVNELLMFRKLNAVGDTRRDDLEMLFEGGNQFFAFFVCLDCSLDLINLFFGQKNDLGLQLPPDVGFLLALSPRAAKPSQTEQQQQCRGSGDARL